MRSTYRLGLAVLVLAALALAGCDSSSSDSGGGGSDNSGGGGNSFNEAEFPRITAAPVFYANDGVTEISEANPGDYVLLELTFDSPNTLGGSTYVWLQPDDTSSSVFGSASLYSSDGSTVVYQFYVNDAADLGVYRMNGSLYDGNNENLTSYEVDSGGSGNFVATYYTASDEWGPYDTGIAATPIEIVEAGGGGGSGSTISTDYTDPTYIDDVIGSLSLAAGESGYFTFNPQLQMNSVYGVYVTDETTASGDTPLALYVTYSVGGSPVSVSADGTTSGSLAMTALFTGSGGYPFVVEVDNTAGTEAISFSVEYQAGLEGGASVGSDAGILLDTPTVIGAQYNAGIYSFVAADTTATLSFTNMTYGVEISIYEGAGGSPAGLPAQDQAMATSDTSGTFDFTGLTASETYQLWIHPPSGFAAPAVGTLEITSPTLP